MFRLMGKLQTLTRVYFTFFIDTLGWAIVFPIFAPYFIARTDLSAPLLTLGLFLMAFPLGQFFFAPVLGGWADRYGKRRILALTVLLSFFGMALTAWSFQINQLSLLFFSRLITGCCAGNMSLCLACLADAGKTEHERTRYFGYLSMFAGVSFILGALAGGKLSDPEIVSWFSPAFPLWMTTILTGFNVLCIAPWLLKDPHLHHAHHAAMRLLKPIDNIMQALHRNRVLYFVYFLFLFAWSLLFQFTPVLVVEKYGFSGSDIGDLSIYMGFFWILGSIYLNKWLKRWFSSIQILKGCLILFTLFCAALTIPCQLWISLIILGGCITLSGLAWPLCLGILAEAAPKETQGKSLGISQSVQSLALSTAPAIGGVISQLSINAPFFLSAAASLTAGLIYYLSKGDQ